MQPSGNIFLHTWKHTHETYQILKITQKYTFTYSDTAANMSFVRDTFNAVLDVPHYSKTVLFYFMALSTPRGAVLPCVITEVKEYILCYAAPCSTLLGQVMPPCWVFNSPWPIEQPHLPCLL
jgi:hypothetical protein